MTNSPDQTDALVKSPTIETEDVLDENVSVHQEPANDVLVYGGIELKIRDDDKARIDPDCYKNHVITNYDANLEQKLAVAFDQHQPALIESGSGLGKTSTIERMCANLGWNCFYVNCDKFEPGTIIGGGGTDESTKSGLTDWKDGIVVQAIRHGGVLVLDEYNLMRMENGAGRMHEILDAVLRGKSHISLPENKGEMVPVHPDLQIVVLQNPPNSPLYPDRNELGVANFSRFVYFKEPEDLPKEVWLQRTQSVIGGVAHEDPTTLNQSLKQSSDLSVKDLGAIDGMQSLMEQYLEFHYDISALAQQGSNQQLATGQGQPLYFVYSRDSERVLQFMARYYNGNPVETLHRALEYYYVNKFETEEDRNKVRELIGLISLADYEDEKRKSLESEQETEVEAEPVTPAHKARTLSSDIDGVSYYRMIRARGFDDEQSLPALCGDDSPEAFSIRSAAFRGGVTMSSVLKSLAGVHGAKADEWRINALKQGVAVSEVIDSLAGTHSEDPALSRVSLFRQGTRPGVKNRVFNETYRSMARSLAGRDDEEAAEARTLMKSTGTTLLRSLRSTFNPAEKDFWWGSENNDEMPLAFVGSILFPIRVPIELATRSHFAKECLLESYAGVDSEEAMEFRQSLRGKNSYTKSMLVSLAGLQNEEHWAIRNEMLERSSHSNNLELVSITCVDSKKANSMRLKEASRLGEYYSKDWEKVKAYGSLEGDEAARLRESIFKSKTSEALVHLVRSPFSIAVARGIGKDS